MLVHGDQTVGLSCMVGRPVLWSAAGRMLTMPRAYRKELRDEVVAVARRREAG